VRYLFFVSVLLSIGLIKVYSQQASSIAGANDWIFNVIKETSTIKPGMTRSDLLKVFEIEGGLSTGTQRTFAYRSCPYIKVDVEFEPIGRPARDRDGRVTLIEDGRDLIKKISKPYLDLPVMD
jgi:hypothetical protein